MLTFGQIKYFAHQFVRRIPIPIFAENKINKKINEHVQRIRRAKTRRRR